METENKHAAQVLDDSSYEVRGTDYCDHHMPDHKSRNPVFLRLIMNLPSTKCGSALSC